MTAPHRLWYLIPAAFVVAIIAHGVAGIGAFVRAFDAMPRLDMPGEGSAELAAGPIVLYYEVHGGGEREVSAACAMRGEAGAVDLEQYSGSATYSVMGRSGVALFEATLAQAGTYEVMCETEGERFVLAIAPGLAGPALRFFGILGLLLLAAAGSGALIALRRKRAPAPVATRLGGL